MRKKITLSQEHKENIRKSMKKWHKTIGFSEETKKRISFALTGKKLSDEHKRAVSLAQKGKPGRNKGKHWKIKDTSKMHHTAWNKGTARIMPKCRECNKVLSYFLAKTCHKHYLRSGENSPTWRKDRTTLKGRHERKYHGIEYKQWRHQVKIRDNFKCKISNSECSGRLEVHHILPWRDYVELRYEINNGITLCHAHHPRKRAEEKRLSPYFMELVSASK